MLERWREVPLFFLATFLFGTKSYIVYRFVLSIEINSILQEVIIFLNPFIVSFVFFCLSIWLQTPEKQRFFVRFWIFIGSVVIYFNLLFYRSFTDFLTIPQFFQLSNVVDLTTSIFTLIKWYDLFLFIDVVIIWVISKRETIGMTKPYSKRTKIIAVVISLLLLSTNFLLAEMERPQLLSRGFDREYIVKNIGLFYFHLYDVVLQSKMHTQRVIANSHDISTVQQYVDDYIRTDERSELYGIAEGRNVIFISAESLQSFVIQNTLHGEEITPFLNGLIEDSQSFYFDEFYHQTAQGKTSDSEFIVENSLYPLPGGAVFFTHGQNRYHSLAEMLAKAGYTSAVFHANSSSFWNRNQMYPSLSIETFYDVTFYEVDEANSVGWGLKDKDFFEQSIPYLRELNEPFYAKFITLTNHFPFDLDEQDQSLAPYDSNSNTLNNYFTTVRYMDEAIEQFFYQLKLNGLYDNSVIVIMGDHDGISANHNKAMAMYLDKEEISPYDYVKLQRVPFIIHIPGYEMGEVKSTVAGQIDVKPTLLHLLGVDTSVDIFFGNDLFHSKQKGYIVLRNGDFISDNFIYTNSTCYDRESGAVVAEDTIGQLLSEEQVDVQAVNPCMELKTVAEEELFFSDQIIYGDLFRFIDFARE